MFQIQVFRTVKVFYQSHETDETEENLLRCSPQFYGRPRYDSAMINTAEGIIFGRLIHLFVLRANKEDKGVAVALICPYDGSVAHTLRKKDAIMGFHRVRPGRASKPEFFFAQQIIRGTLLVPAGDTPTDFLVFDVLDGDMFLRTQVFLEDVD
jgi:hypothetical protein